MVTVALAANVTNLKESVKVINDWTGRFQGDVKFSINEEVVGWEVLLTCSAGLTHIDVGQLNFFLIYNPDFYRPLREKLFENIVRKGENADNQNILLSPKFFYFLSMEITRENGNPH